MSFKIFRGKVHEIFEIPSVRDKNKTTPLRTLAFGA
jgi:hypothetical protein